MKKTLFMLFFCFGLLFCFSTFSEGEEWEEIIRSDEGKHAILLDKDSVRRTSASAKKDIIRVTGKIVEERPEGSLSKEISYTLISYEIDCKQRYLRVLRKYYVFQDGTDEQGYDKQDRQWAKIEPESPEDQIHKHLCTER
jgi:hypothetical protein